MSINKPRGDISTSRRQSALRLVALAAFLSLAACEESSGSGPGGVSEGEARALDEAAEMLDARRLPDEALPPLDGPPGDTPESAGESGQGTPGSDGDNTE